MATIQIRPDNVDAGLWRIKWAEKDEIIGSIIRHRSGSCQIVPSGPHWSPMKSFAAFFFDSPEQAGHHLKQLAQAGDVILFKGSRGTRVELALERFLA